MLGDCQKNRWCAFCKHWYDPTNSALKPRVNKNLFDVNEKIRCRCNKKSLITPALSTCPLFERKF